jgi:hypothetical protein
MRTFSPSPLVPLTTSHYDAKNNLEVTRSSGARAAFLSCQLLLRPPGREGTAPNRLEEQMKIPGKNAGSGSISGLGPQFAERGRLKPHALRHQKGEQKSNREALRRVRAVNRLCDCKAPASARRNDDVTAVTQTKQRIEISSNREKEACFSGVNVRPRWYSRAGTPTAGVAGAASKRPYENEGKFKGRYGNTRLASDKIFETKQAEKRIKDPSIFVSVRKKSAVCFLQLTQNLNDTMFRLERVAERTKFKGRAEFARGDANGGRRGRSERAPLRRQHQMRGRKVRFRCDC